MYDEHFEHNDTHEHAFVRLICCASDVVRMLMNLLELVKAAGNLDRRGISFVPPVMLSDSNPSLPNDKRWQRGPRPFNNEVAKKEVSFAPDVTTAPAPPRVNTVLVNLLGEDQAAPAGETLTVVAGPILGVADLAGPRTAISAGSSGGLQQSSGIVTNSQAMEGLVDYFGKVAGITQDLTKEITGKPVQMEMKLRVLSLLTSKDVFNTLSSISLGPALAQRYDMQ